MQIKPVLPPEHLDRLLRRIVDTIQHHPTFCTMVRTGESCGRPGLQTQRFGPDEWEDALRHPENRLQEVDWYPGGPQDDQPNPPVNFIDAYVDVGYNGIVIFTSYGEHRMHVFGTVRDLRYPRRTSGDEAEYLWYPEPDEDHLVSGVVSLIKECYKQHLLDEDRLKQRKE